MNTPPTDEERVGIVDHLFDSWSRRRYWLSDLVRQYLSGALDHRLLIDQTDLPAELKTTVTDVVNRTRIWPSERCAVAKELCDHFADGLAAGRTTQRLVEDFGDTQHAAKLIRRAKIRCRSWKWHIWHRGWQVSLTFGLLTIFVFSFLVIRYQSASPTIRFDLIAQFDDQSRSIPESQRAWPFYRAGLARLPARNVDLRAYALMAAMAEGPAHADWEESREFLTELEDSVALFLKATEYEQLGFINRDPGNEDWIRWSFGSGWESYNAPGTMGPSILLAQTQDMRTIAGILRGGMNVAIEDSDGPRAVTLATALLKLADHSRQTHYGYVADLATVAHFRSTVRQITSLVLEHPELLSDEDLQKLSDQVGSALGGGRITFRLDRELEMWEDSLQRLYSDDGNGNGRITEVGLTELIRENKRHLDQNLVDSIQTGDDTPWSKKWSATLLGSTIAPRIADRRTMLNKMTQLNAFRQEMVADIDTAPSESQYVREANRIVKEESLRYLPITSACRNIPGWESDNNSARRQVAVNVERDAALLMIVLERYRREMGSWPQSLDDLVPAQLETVPVDLFSQGESGSLVYRIIDDRPRLYSVGPNHTDDQGQPPTSDEPGWSSDSGDWQLIPPGND